MRRHIVGAFGLMHIKAATLGRDLRKKALQILADIRVGIFLDQQGGRRMPAIDGQQPVFDAKRRQPRFDGGGDLEKTLAARLDMEPVQRLPHAYSSSPNLLPIKPSNASSTSAAPGPLAVTTIVEPMPAPSVKIPMIEEPPTV